MTPKLFLTLLAAISALSLAAAPDGTVVRRYPADPAKNLVRNGSFTSRTDHWHNTMGKSGSVSVSADGEHKKQVGKMSVPAPGMKTYQGIIQGVKVADIMASLKADEKAYIVFTAETRRENVTGGGSCVGVSFLDAAKRIGYAETPYFKGTHPWKKHKIVRQIPTGTRRLHLSAIFAPKSTGDLYLDNIKLVIEVRSSAPDAVPAPAFVPEKKKIKTQFRLPAEKVETGWFFSPGEKTAAFLETAEKAPVITVTDFYGKSFCIKTTPGNDGVSFAVPTEKPGYFLLKNGTLTQAFAVAPDQTRLALPANHFGCNFHLLRISFRDGKRELDLARRAGIGWIRGGGIEWDGVRTKADEDRFFKSAERIYAYSKSTGIGILSTISYTAQYASTAPKDQSRSVWARCAPRWELLEAYAERLARFRNARYWEIMNEPDAEVFWKGTWENWQKGDDRAIIRDAVTYYKTAKKGILKAIPDAKFLYMATTSSMPQGNTYRPFFKTTLEMGMADEFDIMNIHYISNISLLREMLKPYGADKKPTWVTEIGFHSGSNSSERQQLLVDITQQIEQLAAGAEKVFKYDFRNDGTTSYHEHNFGMIRRDFSPKPNYVGFTTMIGLLHDAKFAGTLNMLKRSDRGYVRAYAFDSPENGRVNALWLCDAKKADVTVTSSEKSLTVIDLMGNKTVYPVKNGRTVLKLDELPVFIKGRITGDGGIPRYPGEVVVRRYPMTPEPILKNGDMAEGSRHWGNSMGKNGKITVVEDGERGKKVLSVHALLPNEKEFAGMRQRIRLSEVIGTLAPGETAYFTYSAYCRRLNVVGHGVNIGVDFYKKGVRSQWNETPYRSGSSNWERMTVSRKIAPDTDELVVNCNFAPKTTGTFLMDDISLAIEVRKKEEMGH